MILAALCEISSRKIMIAASFLALAGCEQGGQKFDIPIAVVHKELAQMGAPPFVFGSQDIDFILESDRPERMTWAVKQHGSAVMRFDVELVPTGSATMVRTHVQGANPEVRKRLVDNASIANLYVVSINERIASTLEHREFDISRTYPALRVAVAANIGTLSAQLDSVAAADQRRYRDNIRKAYADEMAGNVTLKAPQR